MRCAGLVMVLLMVAGGTGYARYPCNAPPAAVWYAPAAGETAVTGFIEEVFPDYRTVTLRAPDSTTLTFMFDDNTRVVSETGRYLLVGELQAGHAVTVTYTGTTDNPCVLRVLFHGY